MTEEQRHELRQVLNELNGLQTELWAMQSWASMEAIYPSTRLRIIARARLILHILWRVLR